MLEDPLGKMAESGKVGSMKLKIEDITHNMFNAIRSTVLGVLIGIVPAAGPDIAAFLSYNEAKKASKHPEQFGNGSAEGIVAAEAANNGVTGGSLIPLLTPWYSGKCSGSYLPRCNDYSWCSSGPNTVYPAC